jgi:hypothetical protein
MSGSPTPPEASPVGVTVAPDHPSDERRVVRERRRGKGALLLWALWAVVVLGFYYEQLWRMLATGRSAWVIPVTPGLAWPLSSVSAAAARAVVAIAAAVMVFLAVFALGAGLCAVLRWRPDDGVDAVLFRAGAGFGALIYLSLPLAAIDRYTDTAVFTLLGVAGVRRRRRPLASEMVSPRRGSPSPRQPATRPSRVPRWTAAVAGDRSRCRDLRLRRRPGSGARVRRDVVAPGPSAAIAGARSSGRPAPRVRLALSVELGAGVRRRPGCERVRHCEAAPFRVPLAHSAGRVPTRTTRRARHACVARRCDLCDSPHCPLRGDDCVQRFGPRVPHVACGARKVPVGRVAKRRTDELG